MTVFAKRLAVQTMAVWWPSLGKAAHFEQGDGAALPGGEFGLAPGEERIGRVHAAGTGDLRFGSNSVSGQVSVTFFRSVMTPTRCSQSFSKAGCGRTFDRR